MAEEDVFGDSSLFEEFDKEREASGSFIFYEKDEHGSEDRSKIIFQLSDESSSDDDDESKEKVAEQSVAYAVKTLKKQNDKFAPINGALRGEQNGLDGDSDEPSSDEECKSSTTVGKDRIDKSTTFKLNYERNKFKRFCNIIDSTRFIHEEESAGVQVIYQNNSFSRKYKTQIEDFIRYLIVEDTRRPQERLQKLDLKNTQPSCADLNDQIPIAKRTEHMVQAHAILGCSQFYRGFLFDTLGWPLVEYNPSLTDSWDIPTYEQVYEDILPLDEELMKAKEKKQQKERAKPKCWNCDGDHMLGDCKLPRNQQKINENKRAMMMENAQKQGPKGPTSGRYHKDTAAAEKFKPGKISSALREALGIDDDQLPVYIYKMRALGYPPGWMEEAKPDADGLAMFDIEGKEVDNEAQNEGCQLDVEKIIEYPGFTVEAPEYMEEAEVYGLPPLQPHQLKSTLMASLQQEESMKRAQEVEEEAQNTKRIKVTLSDMDLEDPDNSNSSGFLPPLPRDTPPPKPPVPDSTPPATPTTDSENDRTLSREPSQARSDSPSLEELEAQYQMLQKSLQKDGDMEEGEVLVLDSYDGESEQSATAGEASDNPVEIDSQDESVGDKSANPIVVGDDSMNDSDVEFLKPKLMRIGSASSIQTFGELGSGSPMSSQPSTPQPGQNIDVPKPALVGSASMSKDYGTPILKRVGSVELLPTDSKFAQGIEDHIPFENLPDSTGTYEKMRKLIGRIREKLPTRKKKS